VLHEILWVEAINGTGIERAFQDMLERIDESAQEKQTKSKVITDRHKTNLLWGCTSTTIKK